MSDLPESCCLDCGMAVDAATSVEKDAQPQPGDVTVCMYCGHVMAFAADLTLRPLTDEEMHAIAGDRRLLLVQRMLGEVRAEGKIPGPGPPE